MKVEIVDKALSKNFEKLINKLVKTSLKYANFKIKKSKVCISFVERKEIRELNKKFRNKDSETDVLSFPNLELKPGVRVTKKQFKNDIDPSTNLLMLGDIIICDDVAHEQAKEYNHSYEREVCYLIVHGMFHLLGFDHETDEDKIVMRTYEEATLRKYHITR